MIPAGSHQLFDRLLTAAEGIILSTHINPDGDAIGSEYSLARFLRSRGKRPRIINHDPTPDLLKFIVDPTVSAEIYDQATHDPALEQADLIVLVDNSAPDRLGTMEPAMTRAAARTLCIDHHPARNAPWLHNIVDVDACATTAMIYELTHASGWSLDLAAAEAIYVGLMTDTGCFRFNSTNAQAHRLASALLSTGVEPARIYQAVYERNSPAFTRLLGHALKDLRLDAEGMVASVRIRRELIESLDAEDVDMSEFITPLLAMDGVRVAVLYRELDDGRIKVSLRSKGDLNVHSLACEFGGGGHRNASGIVIDGPLDDVELTVTRKAADLVATSSSDRPSS